ncbi:response regulator [Roseovarius arcticus]|uniref:response regulator n=1 Tax=Roseovarius arcticus TaxID=2547404 RepID=UPI0011101643|nr:response regulator [Roseovarius arcticus]
MKIENRLLPAVLVVEDETLIRMDVVDIIEDAGFTAYEAGSADAAIELMERHDNIKILFTDIEMPGSMDGLKLAAYVRDRWPPVAILIVSGAVGMRESALPQGSSFVSKPYVTSHITETLHEIATQLK